MPRTVRPKAPRGQPGAGGGQSESFSQEDQVDLMNQMKVLFAVTLTSKSGRRIFSKFGGEVRDGLTEYRPPGISKTGLVGGLGEPWRGVERVTCPLGRQKRDCMRVTV